MTERFTLVFVCDDPIACSAFYESLQDKGFRVFAAHNAGGAVMCSCTEAVNGILVYHDDAQLGRVIGCDIKSLFPTIPVVLVSTGVEMTAPSSDLDAICYISSLDEEMASTMAMLFRHVLTHRPFSLNRVKS
jgi:hypothetical protein